MVYWSLGPVTSFREFLALVENWVGFLVGGRIPTPYGLVFCPDNKHRDDAAASFLTVFLSLFHKRVL